MEKNFCQKSNLESPKVTKHPPVVASEEGETPRWQIGGFVAHSTWKQRILSPELQIRIN